MKIKFRLAWFVLFVSAAVAYPSAVRSQSMILENYDQSSVPKNKGGDTYPVYYQSGTEGGPFHYFDRSNERDIRQQPENDSRWQRN